MKYHVKIPFPNSNYAESAMKTIGVDLPFQESKNKKTTIRREMYVEVLEDGIVYLNILLSCEPGFNDGQDITSLRTCASSMFS